MIYIFKFRKSFFEFEFSFSNRWTTTKPLLDHHVMLLPVLFHQE
jgi:hypothetical protein